MSLSEVSEELEATACDFCIFRRKLAGEAGDILSSQKPFLSSVLFIYLLVHTGKTIE